MAWQFELPTVKNEFNKTLLFDNFSIICDCVFFILLSFFIVLCLCTCVKLLCTYIHTYIHTYHILL